MQRDVLGSQSGSIDMVGGVGCRSEWDLSDSHRKCLILFFP